MSTTTTQRSSSSVVIPANTLGLIVGISVVATILLIVSIVAITIWCRNVQKKRKKDRSRLYMVHDGQSPFSSVNGPPSGGLPSYNANSYENKGLDVGEFRPNPLADNPYYNPSQFNPNQGRDNLPQRVPSFNIHGRYDPQRLAMSTQSLNYQIGEAANQNTLAFHQSLYEKLTDTIHEHKGRPLYVCKREDYFSRADYFDIIGKTRVGDWLVRPRANIPNKPKRKNNSSKKRKAPPKPSNHSPNNEDIGKPRDQDVQYRSNGFLNRPGAAGVITTPFGAAERVPARYLSGSALERSDNFEPRFTSLPRDGKLKSSHLNGHMVRRQTSMGAADQSNNRDNSSNNTAAAQQQLDEHLYAQVMKKNALNGGIQQAADVPDRLNPHRRRINTIEESPQEKPTPKNTQAQQETQGQGHRERSGSQSTIKSLGITDQFRFLEQYDTEEERF